ncbi:SDR family NAD(P)-dependent oxidoreductase [Aliikangiella sp. IMCC44359]|uniref:SDR family NAD(P)-dependent oxidoreductase n=1 Tax=Aliikangiella sp. IMCC44359 TaxID=3459125 RepID=UPI00403AAB7A
MAEAQVNYRHELGNEIVGKFKQAWNGELPLENFLALFDEQMIFNFQQQKIEGVEAYKRFVMQAKQLTEKLDVEFFRVFTRDNYIQAYYRWSSNKWHPDIIQGSGYSNYCKIVIRFEKGRIAELWQQVPDFLYLLGKIPQQKVMQYPVVIKEKLLLEQDGKIFPSNDSQTVMMSDLFKRMNDCFLGHSSLSNMKDIQHPDMVFYNGDTKGQGIQAWKTFAYALQSCLGDLTPKRIDDLYIRHGNKMSVCLRADSSIPSSTLLQCANGLQACLTMEVENGKIKTLYTHPENYIAFLDTDFARYKERLYNLFHGKKEPVKEPDIETSFDMSSIVTADTKIDTHRDNSFEAQLNQTTTNNGVAVIGMAGLFPQCENVEQYWQALVEGVDLFTDVPETREYDKLDSKISRGGYINDVEKFDAAFFQILPEEARFIDPQQRLLLEQVIQCIQDSGHPASDFAGERTGLFICTQSEDYKKLLQDHHLVLNPLAWGGNETAMFPPKVARLLNIQGPVHFVNSECASSLVALHEASRLIRQGVIDQAIIGAANLILHPYGFAVREENLLTPEAYPRIFSKDAQGQIRSEAIVTVILKSLIKAEKDNDNIYGLIAGSAVNNSGKTLSLAAGNVQQQTKAITDAWKDAQLTPADISLVECHASGVRGGDFAEMTSLKLAFKGSELQQPCHVTSVKANIGHTEAASGMTTLVKALLQMKHNKMIGIKGLEEVDPELHIDSQRLNLLTGAHDWHTTKEKVVGLSGFAVGGYNAHVVVKEYQPKIKKQLEQLALNQTEQTQQIIVLSAHNTASLEKQLVNYKNYLLDHPQTNLAHLAYTLQVGREVLKHRVAMVATSVKQCVELIESLLNGKPENDLVFSGKKRAKTTVVESSQMLSEPINLARLWAEGNIVTWQQKNQPLLSGLPAYPFDRKRFWLPDSAKQKVATHQHAIHPLLQDNQSNLYEQCYLTRFDGSEPFLSDHKVKGIKVLPGVAYLEMIRVAIGDAFKKQSSNALHNISLRNVVWVQPIALMPDSYESIEIKVVLQPLDESLEIVAFEVFSEKQETQLIHCQGQVAISNKSEEQLSQLHISNDLQTIESRCDKIQITAAKLYSVYSALGLDYGAAYQGVKQISIGNSEVLAKITLDNRLIDSQHFVLHPGIMDSAVHASIGLVMDADGKTGYEKLPLPFAVEQVDLYRPCTSDMWAWIRLSASDDDNDSSGGVQKIDIDLMDKSGRLCVRMIRFSSRTGEKNSSDRKQQKTVIADKGEVFNQVLASLKNKVAELLLVQPADIDVDEELNELGFDSIHLTNFGNQLNEMFNLPVDRPLNPTIFFEYPTLKTFSGFLIEEYADQFSEKYGTEIVSDEITQEENVQSINQHKSRLLSRTPTYEPQNINTTSDVAIIGMSGCFPMADNLDEFWQNLSEGKDCITQIPPDRWDWQALYGDPKREDNKTDIKWGGFINGVADFDPLFFGISPREAELMDPQQRLLMTHVWQAIEDAGYSAKSLSGSNTAIFVGTANSGYSNLLTDAGVPIEGASATGMVPSVGPNRMSFFLNLHGPSEPIETACSSSLVAINRAVEGIKSGQFDMAIVGGVNTIVTPQGHIGFGKAGMLTPDGRCKTFSDQADGYVRGEGVGILVLKRLEAAEQSGDNIYAVIKSSAENHGGRANALTAPNPKAQAELLKAAYSKANIDPHSIGYFEAHGTGTKLGDPIEVNAMKAAFSELYPSSESGYCGVGSVKSNIGHLELAAGVAGVIKVLLQLKHQTLVKSLHCDQVNPYIQFEKSPFYVVQENRPWLRTKDKQGKELPRRAGVSSFGFGGVNAHVVIEEYTPQAAVAATENKGSYIIVLSARNEQQLDEAGKRLYQTLSNNYAQGDLLNIAYTLQVGREAMDARLAIVVDSFDELLTKLNNLDNAEGVYRGRVKPNAEMMAVFLQDEDLQSAVESWVAKGKFNKLCELWVKGLELDWQNFYNSKNPRRVSLPTYPFAYKRYWVPSIKAQKAESLTTKLHPLIHCNTSDFLRQQYTSTFNGQEFFLADHRVGQDKILPGAAYLEMVRFAFNNASSVQNDRGIKINNIVWPQPVSLTSNESIKNIHIELKPQSNGNVDFEFYSLAAKNNKFLHCKGLVSASQQYDQVVDIQNLKQLCNRKEISHEQVYSAFEAMHLNYGPAHRGIENIYVGDNQLLAKIKLPQVIMFGAEAFELHPVIVDCGLQACIGFMLAKDPAIAEMKPPLPFKIKQVEMLGRCVPEMWVSVKLLDSSQQSSNTQTLDIDLCDSDGKVCVRIEGFTSRTLTGKTDTVATSQDIMLEPRWIQVKAEENSSSFSGQTLIIGENEKLNHQISSFFEQAIQVNQFSPDALSSINQLAHIVWIAPTQNVESAELGEMIEQQEHGVIQLFKLVKYLLSNGYANVKLKWTVLTHQTQSVDENELADPTHAALAGFLGSLAKENPAWKISVFDLPHSGLNSKNDEMAKLFNLACTNGEVWAYRNSSWYQQKLTPCDNLPVQESLYKSKGVYVVIGGAGGIGEVWSEYMMRTYQAQIIWIGRRPKDAALTYKLQKLAKQSQAPFYISADATDKESLQLAYDTIKNIYGTINGVVHSALVLHDKSIAAMNESSFRAALSSKVDISVRLAQVFNPKQLDFMMFFSSLVAFGKPPGQSNYVAGCQFKDAFAKSLSLRWPCVVKVMNWGYWGTTGVGDNDKVKQVMTRLGVGSIEPDVAMNALEQLLVSEQNQLALVSVNKPIEQLASGAYASFLQVPQKIKVAQSETKVVTETGSVEQQLIDAIKKTLSEALKVGEDEIDIDEAFSGYGLDSVTGVSLTQTLNDSFDLDLDVTLFFDYTNVQELSDYLLENYQAAIEKKFSASVAKKKENGFEQNKQYHSPLVNSDVKEVKVQSHDRETQQVNVEQSIKKLLSDALKVEMEEIDIDESFSGYGLDSVTGVQLAQTLNDSFGIELDVTLFFDYDSVSSLASYIIEQHPELSVSKSPETEEKLVNVTSTSQLINRFVKSSSTNYSPVDEAFVNEVNTTSEIDDVDAIAIVGISGSFPQAENIEQLWDNLQAGKNCIRQVPAERWDWQQVQGEENLPVNEACFQWGGFMEGIDLFDAEFFGISEQEAKYMSPQQRLLLTHSYKAVEEAGETPKNLSEKTTGVFIASVPSEYLNLDAMTNDIPLVVVGSSTSMIPNRISYSMNLTGPSEHYDTACSSTFTALHRAVQSIQQGECEQAIVGSVNLLLSPAGYIGFESMDYLSAQGKMAAFGPGADGFVRSEAVGAVLLKPLKQAIADGNHIHAVIKGTGLSHGGNTVSMTTPNGKGMKQAMKRAYKTAKVNPDSVAYVEAHGISNALGDAIEMSAIKATYADPQRETYCHLGHSKAVIGYPEVASGMVALFKVIMALKNKTIPGTPGFDGLHQNISLNNSKIAMEKENQPWPSSKNKQGLSAPRRAAINNFGFSGVCGHLILEEYIEPIEHSEKTVSEERVFIFSAKTPPQLTQLLKQMKLFVETNGNLSLADFAWTLQVGREAMACRAAIIAQTYDELLLGLEKLSQNLEPQGSVECLVANDEQEKLAQRWVAGNKVDWTQETTASPAKRLSIPGYPLEQKSYWIQRDNSRLSLMNKVVEDVSLMTE